MRVLHPPRWTLRARLTTLHAAAFLIGAALLMAVMAGLVDHALSRTFDNGATSARLSAELDAAVPTVPVGAATMPPSGKPTVNPAAALKKTVLTANAEMNRAVEANALRGLLTDSLLTLGILVPVTALLGWLLAGRALRPVAAITESARRASETRLSERLALPGPRDEITELADTFDAMLDRLEHAFDAQRRFTANASHELRTPLTVARTSIEVVLAKPERTPAQLVEMAHDVHTALDRANLLVDNLLTLARSEHLALPHDDVDLAAIAEDALDSRTRLLFERGVSVQTRLGAAPVTGDRGLLDHLAVNLIDNAVRHNHDGGHIDVATGQDRQGAFLSVTNTGPPVEPADLPRLFEPFQRADGPDGNDPGGLGLGLSIVQAVANAHHAGIEARANPGGGLAPR